MLPYTGYLMLLVWLLTKNVVLVVGVVAAAVVVVVKFCLSFLQCFSFALNLFSVNIHVHQKPSSAIFREGIRLGLVYRVRVSFR